MLDIIPDIHGQFGKLEALLRRLGYRERAGAWRHPERRALFLGDYIDRGPENRAVIRAVRAIVEAGSALAIMGNHELNAIRFHAMDLGADAPLRPQTPKNIRQHASFIEEFPDAAARREALDFFCTLPLWLEAEGLRAVHAAWSATGIAALRALAPDGRLDAATHLEVAVPAHPLHDAVELVTKGPEISLPEGARFADKGGEERREMRIAWWRRHARTFREAAISVPDPEAVPDLALPDPLGVEFYDASAPPVFFGHYWLSPPFVLEAANALCLDYSAGTDGPLVAYRWEGEGARLSLDRLVAAGG